MLALLAFLLPFPLFMNDLPRLTLDRRTWIRRRTDWYDERTGECAPMSIASKLDNMAGSSAEPEDPAELLKLGREDIAGGNLLRAQGRIQRSFELAKTPAEKANAAASLGAIWRERSEPSTAISVVRPWAEKGHPACIACLAGALVDQGEKAEAVALLNHSMETWPRLAENHTIAEALKNAKSRRHDKVVHTDD